MSRVTLITLSIFLLITLATIGFAGDPFPEKDYPDIVPPLVQTGSFGTGLGKMNEPTALAISKKNEIYIAECFNRRIQVFDVEGRVLRAWYGTDKGELTYPQGIGVDEDGHVFVSDAQDHIAVYNERGEYLYQFGKYGDTLGALDSPTNLAISKGKVYVTDVGNNRIEVFDTSGKPLMTIGRYGSNDGEFTVPRSVAADDEGCTYVVDVLHRVQKFDPQGNFLLGWGGYGGFSGQLAEPSDISFTNGLLYVADQVNHRLQAFDKNGKFVLQWGRHPEAVHAGFGRTHYPAGLKVSPDGKYAVVIEPFEYRFQVFEVASIKNLPHVDVSAWWEKFPKFHYGGGLRIARISSTPRLAELTDAKGPKEVMIITEPDLHKVVAFTIDTEGKLDKLYAIGEFGTGPLKWETIGAKAPLRSGALLIGDAGAQVVQKVDLIRGKHISTHFGPGKGAGQFNGPAGISEAPNGNIYICDFHNNRVQVFNSDLKYLFEFGGLGSAPGKMFAPLSSAFDPSGRILYVADTGNQRIEAFDLKGRFLFSFGHLTRPGEWGKGTFQWPFDIAVSPSGDLYITDPSLQLVQKFTARGKFLKEWGGWGTQPGQFYKPKGIDVDSKGRVYVIDFGNHRGQIFDKDGKFLGIFGEGILYPSRE